MAPLEYNILLDPKSYPQLLISKFFWGVSEISLFLYNRRIKMKRVNILGFLFLFYLTI